MTLLLLLAVSALAAEVPGGIYDVDGREIYTMGFSIDSKAGPESKPCTERSGRPSWWEWRIASQQKGFKPSGAFEHLAQPSEAACDIHMGVVEAEGVGGYHHFAGWGQSKGEAEVLGGEGSTTDGHIRIHSNPWHFWGEEAKPAPRAERCLTRPVSEASIQKKVLASSLNIRTRRDLKAEKLLNIPIGTEVTVIYEEGDWAYVEAPKSVFDDSGSEPTTHHCTVIGWTLGKYLTGELPKPVELARAAEKALAEGALLDAVSPAERVAAWYPAAPSLQQLLVRTYTAVESPHLELVKGRTAELTKGLTVDKWTPANQHIQLATHCSEDPAIVPWQTLGEHDAKTCVLPWSTGDWIDLDLHGIGPECAGEWSDKLAEKAQHDPDVLSVKVPAQDGIAFVGVHVLARTQLGVAEGGGWESAGWDSWRTVALETRPAGTAGFVDVPMKELVGKAKHAVEVRVDLFDAGRQGKVIWSGTVMVYWPVSC